MLALCGDMPNCRFIDLQPLDQLSLLHNKSSKLIRRTPIVGHHNMIDKSEERSTHHAVRHLTSYVSGRSTLGSSTNCPASL